MFVVYVLQSLKNGRLYIGCTNNLKRRLSEYNSGKSEYTKSTRPFKVIYSEMIQTLIQARRREQLLKSGQGRAWLKRKLAGRSSDG